VARKIGDDKLIEHWTLVGDELGQVAGKRGPTRLGFSLLLKGRPEGVVFVFDGGVLDEADVVGMGFPDGEILSAAFQTPAEVRGKVKPLLADRLEVALEAVEQGVTALCEQGGRIG